MQRIFTGLQLGSLLNRDNAYPLSLRWLWCLSLKLFVLLIV